MDHYVAETKSLLTFVIANEQLAVDVTKVIEVLRNQEIFEVPKTETYIAGIINFRGEILTVVDTRKKINLSDESGQDKHVIIVYDLRFDEKKVRVGALADKVLNVINISENLIRPVPEFGNYYNPEYLKGAFKVNDGFVMILDIEKIFSSKDVEIINAVVEKNNK